MKTQDGFGTELKKIGQEEFTFEVTLDMDSIRRMGIRAASNVNGRAVRGPITATIVGRKKR